MTDLFRHSSISLSKSIFWYIRPQYLTPRIHLRHLWYSPTLVFRFFPYFCVSALHFWYSISKLLCGFPFSDNCTRCHSRCLGSFHFRSHSVWFWFSNIHLVSCSTPHNDLSELALQWLLPRPDTTHGCQLHRFFQLLPHFPSSSAKLSIRFTPRPKTEQNRSEFSNIVK